MGGGRCLGRNKSRSPMAAEAENSKRRPQGAIKRSVGHVKSLAFTPSEIKSHLEVFEQTMLGIERLGPAWKQRPAFTIMHLRDESSLAQPGDHGGGGPLLHCWPCSGFLEFLCRSIFF